MLPSKCTLGSVWEGRGIFSSALRQAIAPPIYTLALVLEVAAAALGPPGCEDPGRPMAGIGIS
jgi:hypothetical protein